MTGVFGIVGVLTGFAATSIQQRLQAKRERESTRTFTLAALDDLYNLVRLTGTFDHYYPRAAMHRAIEVLNARLADKATADALSAAEYSAIAQALAITALRLDDVPAREFAEGHFGEHLKPASAQGLVRDPLRLLEIAYRQLGRHYPSYPFS